MRFRTAVVCLALVLALAVPAGAADGVAKLIEFDSMVGVSGPFVGTANPIRGINGGGLPWTIAEGRGEVTTDGRVEVTVRGLVFAAGPNTGRNTVAGFKAVVSCRTIDGMGAPAISNVSTAVFPATTAGDADIEDVVTLPRPCFAPLVFVTSPGGNWFAITGV